MCLPEWVAQALTAQRQAATAAARRSDLPAFIKHLPKETIKR